MAVAKRPGRERPAKVEQCDETKTEERTLA